MKINGAVPFEEMLAYELPYDKRWNSVTLCDGEGEPYLFALQKGRNTLSLTVTLGETVTQAVEGLLDAAKQLNAVLFDITRVTGQNPDANYDYQLDLEIPDLRQLPEDEAERSELRQAICDAMDSLSPEHRNMLLLREISGMSYTEIAQVLDLNEGTVKSRLARARIKLAEILVKNGTFAPLNRQANERGVKTHG